MNKNILIIIGVVVTIILLTSIYFYGETMDIPCFEKIAREYCKSQNLTFRGLYEPESFSCNSQDFNPRRDYNKPERFKFLEDEKNKCLIPIRK